MAMVGAPIVFEWVGLNRLFTLIGSLSTLAVGVVSWVVQDAPIAARAHESAVAEVRNNVGPGCRKWTSKALLFSRAQGWVVHG